VVEEFNELASLTGMLLGEGNLNEVAANLEEMRKLLKEIADPAPAKIYLDLLEANLLLFQGHWGEALKLMRPCLEDTRQRGDLQTTSNMDLTFAQILIEIAHWEGISDWEEAETALQEAVDIAGRGVAVQTSPLSLLAGIRILQGRVESAKQMLTEAEAMVGANTYPVEETLLIWMKGHLAIAQDQWDEALDFFKTATKRMKDMGLRWNWARITRDWAEALITRRQPSDLEQARVLLTQCLEIFRQIGATHYAELVDERLSTLNSAIRAEMIDKEKVSADLAMAGRIQGSLMPEKMPIITGWELAAFLEPAQETSGDFYDFITLPDGKIGLLIADVTDKGPGAALFMALSRTLIRTFAALHTADPENAIIAANQRMHEDTRGGLFVSLFYAVLDPNTSTLSYVNAGHNPPYLFRPSDAAHPVSLEKTGTQLGLFDDAIWTHASVKMETGDVLLLYTDGVLDAQNPEEEVFGSERLIAEAKTMLDCPAQELMENLYHVIQKFMGKAPMADDITLVILKRE
jgi:serine phosphatase RsbU (regulator of sigma subunit)